MILHVKPARYLKGSLHLPASKSYSIRAFIIAACGGVSHIIHPSYCDDAKVSISVAKHLGLKITQEKHNTWKTESRKQKVNLSRVNVKESGTVLRFLLPLLPLYAQEALVNGEGTLRGRPNHYLTKVLRAQGVHIKVRGPKESIPIKLSGGQLKGGRIEIEGTLSSQFISALLIACPQLSGNTKLVIKGKRLVSTDYIEMTLQVLKKSGIKIRKINNRSYQIAGKQTYKGLKGFTVPSDYGLAAFLLAAGALVPSKLFFKGFMKNDLIQADGWILEFLKKMGVKYTKSTQSLKISGPFPLKGGNFSLRSCPDLVPIMSVLALFAQGKTRLYDIQHARVKESDRISDLRRELLKIGADVREKKNEITIYPKDKYKKNQLLDPHHDHRLAMAFSVLGLKLGVRVQDIECVSKSYPKFVEDFKAIGAHVRRLRK